MSVAFRPGRTLSFGAEFARQLTRRRTQIALGFLVVLPLILVAAFKVGVPSDPDSAQEGASIADVATSGGANFTLFSIYVASSFLLLVVVALFCGDTVASEASWGTLRYLLASPVPRGRLLRQKLTVGLAYSGFALLLLPTVAMIAGTLAFGWHPLRTQLGADIPALEALGRILLAVGYIAITLLPVAGLAFYLSVRTDAPLGAVGGAVMLWIISNILEAVTALGDLRGLLPTRYGTAWLSLLSSPIDAEDMVKGTVSAVVYTTVFLSLAWWRFLRKDIVS
ncbi:ABC transporter permease [Cryptosporangium phraense]|uniref:ABC transporter permease subunit n=1 Tax=Cryptosporangium phraense TaxID=2593070 RepID=A0A545APE1_9ACTN|nr:ABC transporter permease [Cryptosporangium phraense]TQS43192.1 ABC transporter permease subunit [Cryptosporangium phraense]